MHSLRSKLFSAPSDFFCAFHDWEELTIRICCLLALALSSCSLHWQRLPDDRCPVPLHCLQVLIGTISHSFITVSLWEFCVCVGPCARLRCGSNRQLWCAPNHSWGRRAKREGSPVHPLQKDEEDRFLNCRKLLQSVAPSVVAPAQGFLSQSFPYSWSPGPVTRD